MSSYHITVQHPRRFQIPMLNQAYGVIIYMGVSAKSHPERRWVKFVTRHHFFLQILKGEEPITGRPGASMPPLDFDTLKEDLQSKFENVTDEHVMSAALYPKVMGTFMS